jgi:hypothetical protein
LLNIEDRQQSESLMLRLIFAFFLSIPCLSAFTQNHDAELVYQETDISFKGGKLYKNLTYEIKINNRAGEKFTKVSIPYSNLIRISKLEADLKDISGTVIKKLQKSDITDKSAISDNSLYEDDFVREFTLKHNSYPYTIFYTYQLQEEEFLNIAYWIPVIDRKVPTLKAVLNVEVPADYKISYKNQFIDSFRADTSDLLIKYSWNTSYKDIIEPEIYAPPFNSLMPFVIIVPVLFNYDQPGSFESWSTFGDWHNNLLKGLSDLPQSEKNNILNLISGITGTKEKIKKLYNYLQDHTRYINITIETGGLKPYPASYVALNKYGDCKALSNYFKAVLECAGIQSFYTKVNAGDPKTLIDKKFPSQQFNHIILCVPVQNDTVWLDCTSDNPFNYLGTFTQDRDVFIIENGKSHFTRTPALSDRDVIEARKVVIRQNLQNQATAEFSDYYKGEEYESLFFLSHSVNESDKLRVFRNHFVEDGFELSDFSMTDPDRDTPGIFLTYSAWSNKVYRDYGNDLLIDVIPISIPQFEDPGKRKLPVQIDYPVFKSDTLEYEIPVGYASTGNFLNQEVKSEFGSYKIKSVLAGKKVEIIKSFLLYPGKYAIGKYSDFYNFIRKIIDIENTNKIVTTKQF